MDSRDRCHAYWCQPDAANEPAAYRVPIERSAYLWDIAAPYLTPRTSVLEIGCNVGRNLNYLFEHGITQLSGIEINAKAVELLHAYYPEMGKRAAIYTGPAEDILPELHGCLYDLIFTMAVLEHIHPESEHLFAEIVAHLSSSGHLITIEDEHSITSRHYPRNYREVFEPLGLREVFAVVPPVGLGFDDNFRCRVFRVEASS